MIYFASDFHFGIPDHDGSLRREKLFVQWLDTVKADAEEIYLMGDLFDFWFEYKTVVPKGYARLFGKLAELTDSGIGIHLFRGNHDLWAFDYLRKELGIQIHRTPEIRQFNNRKFFLAHGDGLGPGDHGYKFLKAVFECRLNQWLFRWLHPDLGMQMGSAASRRSRLTKMLNGEGDIERENTSEKEPIVIFSREMAAKDPCIDYFVFGHVHIPEIIPLSEKAKCVILGDWVSENTYARFNGDKIELLEFKI